jgi:uncharacterized protein (DUF2236 family)
MRGNLPDRIDLEREIEELERAVDDPRLGLYGPGSKSWEIGRESVLFLGGGKAALLQLAHPHVARGIEQHSRTRSDPLGRFRRTFDGVFRMVFGDLSDAFAAARRVHAIHSRVEGRLDEAIGPFAGGSPYRANEPEALLWVHATLVDTAIEVYGLVVRPLSYEERDRYYQESKRFARLFAVPDGVLPRDWAGFAEYYRSMIASETLTVGRAARELRRFLFDPGWRLQRPAFRWLEMMTAGLMPARLRREFDLCYGNLERTVFHSSLLALRAAYPRLPERLRYVPAYRAACRRIAADHS